MQLCNINPSIRTIFNMLRQLGITYNYQGFYYAAYAIWLAARTPDSLLLITKWLYPDVAKEYHTTWSAVERGIRTVVSIAWKQNPEYLCELANCPLVEKPHNAQFIAILAAKITFESE